MEAAIALLTLTGLEIILGIDNVVFLAILSQRLPAHQQKKARTIGLLAAMAGRIVLLLLIKAVLLLDQYTIFTTGSGDHVEAFTWKDLILGLGGIFLLGKAVLHIHHEVEGHKKAELEGKAKSSFGAVIFQVLLMDMVFSLDSVITAVGMTQILWVMITAVVVSIIIMMIFAEAISGFIERHPTLKILGLAFLILIGVLLIGDAFGHHIPRGYIYSAMGFAIVVEALQIRMQKNLKKKN